MFSKIAASTSLRPGMPQGPQSPVLPTVFDNSRGGESCSPPPLNALDRALAFCRPYPSER